MVAGGMPWRRARDVGDRGEDLALAHLEALGWVVVERNWRCRLGEIDLVLRDPDGLLVFCEVKTRRSDRCGLPVEAVGRDKARRLRTLAWAWLQERGVRAPRFRIDLVGVLWLPGQEPRVDHLEAVA
ncbi:YraN family protein [Ornithinimicrobium avium]|uniref:UPF0102 protein DV701_00660 n=1 Tax=Ornithinimicrobium avium TaxID=2283195 RepID=A0A345NIM9_9MICO|nr:YraN family protein [Ornithinimicrobium avium]AXH94887.1 YraN family protein [Ornithinimicrobium avium]